MFESIIGHKDAKKELTNHIDKKELSHAYIFYGNEGIGKFSLAKEFSKSLLCDELDEYCGNCQSCHLFDGKTHPDFRIIDSEKSIKVQDILEMIDFIIKKPIVSKKKVVIINDSEKLTNEAQNKLLKTFEEPPSYGVIILIVNNPNKIIDTIKSRGYEIEFSVLGDNEVIEFLKHYSDDKELNYSQIAKFSQGSITKAISTLESDRFSQLIDLPNEIFNSIIKNDEYRLLKIVSQVSEIQEILEFMLTWIRDISILKKSRNYENIFNANYFNELQRQSNYFDIEILLRFFDIIENTKKVISNHVNSVVSLNYCLLKIQEEYYEYSNRRQI
ncbi:MAG: DNA polymerase III subunit delta' [Clostridiales bacterium]|nr:DNA polymerase III subunit delta' [Clostridiales bacterium]